MSASTSTQTAANALSGSYVTTRDDVSLYYKDWGPRDGQLGVADDVPGVEGLSGRCP